MIDLDRKRFIELNSLRKFLKRMGHTVQPKEVSSILRRLDIDGDNRVSFDEFVEAISAVAQDANQEVRGLPMPPPPQIVPLPPQQMVPLGPSPPPPQEAP